MASAKNLEIKKDIVSEIENSINNSESVILFQYQGLTVSDLKDLRQQLKGTDATVKVYKNTLLKRALDELNYDFDGFLEGPNAVLFGKNLLEPIKVLADFAKDHDKLEIRVGIINGSVADLATINEYAAIPSREGLLTMLAGGMLAIPKDLAICLDLYAKKLEENN